MHAQTDIEADLESSVVIKNSEPANQNYHLVTPILLRESSFYSDDEGDPIQRGSTYKSFFSSLVVPGAGQALNKTWWRAGLYAAIEATSVYLLIDYRNNALKGERKYERWADNNWSVVQYSRWLVEYHEVNGLKNPYIDELEAMLNGSEASFNPQQDWDIIGLNVLRNVERNTPYITSDQLASGNFSHTLPDYGSQQYYELIAKYYQYQAGWKDYHTFHDNIGNIGADYNQRYLIDRNGSYASPFFYRGVRLADQFNTDFRRSGYFVSLLIANHIISAFDAFFTVKLKQNKLQATSSMIPDKHFTLTYRF